MSTVAPIYEKLGELIATKLVQSYLLKPHDTLWSDGTLALEAGMLVIFAVLLGSHTDLPTKVLGMAQLAAS